MNILRLKIGTIDTIGKITNLVSVIKEQKYYFQSERILLYNVQVISILVHFQNDISLLIKRFETVVCWHSAKFTDQIQQPVRLV